jgi:hypothetical protein
MVSAHNKTGKTPCSKNMESFTLNEAVKPLFPLAR